MSQQLIDPQFIIAHSVSNPATFAKLSANEIHRVEADLLYAQNHGVITPYVGHPLEWIQAGLRQDQYGFFPYSHADIVEKVRDLLGYTPYQLPDYLNHLYTYNMTMLLEVKFHKYGWYLDGMATICGLLKSSRHVLFSRDRGMLSYVHAFDPQIRIGLLTLDSPSSDDIITWKRTLDPCILFGDAAFATRIQPLVTAYIDGGMNVGYFVVNSLQHALELQDESAVPLHFITDEPLKLIGAEPHPVP